MENDRNQVDNAQEEGRQRQDAQEIRALTDVVSALQRIPDNDGRARVLQGAAAFLRISLKEHESLSHSIQSERTTPNSLTYTTTFSQQRTTSPKEFLLQKQPRTDVERVVCLAYYLTHYRDIQYFKTIDISKLNTEAAQPKFSNAAKAVDNATAAHYLVPASKGNKQLSAPGELFVQALPDREAARTAMLSAAPRRRKRSSNQAPTRSTESDSSNE